MDLTTELKHRTRRVLIVGTEQVSKATCDAAILRQIPWANTEPVEYGFQVYVHDERDDDGFDDLWAVLEFARAHGFDYVRFDDETAPLDPELSGLVVFDHEDLSACAAAGSGYDDQALTLASDEHSGVRHAR